MFMLDTDICIYIIKRKPAHVANRLTEMKVGQLSMSAITYAELMNGAKKSQHVQENLEKLIALSELIEIQPFDKRAAECYGDIRSSLEKQGKNIGSYDLLIAAHALSTGWTLVTNNEREFGRVKGLKIANWAKD
jgi:tRNA(fMet)-specific endonuclease VapC